MKKLIALIFIVTVSLGDYSDKNTITTNREMDCQDFNIQKIEAKPSFEKLQKAVNVFFASPKYFKCKYPDVKINKIPIGEYESVDDSRRHVTLSNRISARWGEFEVQSAMITPPKDGNISIKKLESGQLRVSSFRKANSRTRLKKALESYFANITELGRYFSGLYLESKELAHKKMQHARHSFLSLSFNANGELYRINDKYYPQKLAYDDGWRLHNAACEQDGSSIDYIKTKHRKLLSVDKKGFSQYECSENMILKADSLINTKTNEKVDISGCFAQIGPRNSLKTTQE